MAGNWPALNGIPRDVITIGADEIDRYLRANPRLGLPDGLLPAGDADKPVRERLEHVSAYVIGEYLGAFQAEGDLPGVDPNNPGPGQKAYAERRQRALDHTVDVIERERGGRTSGGSGGGAATGRRLVGVVRRDGRHFADDRGYVSPRGASLLYGLADRVVGDRLDPVDPEPSFAQYAAEGIQYARVFAGELPRFVNGGDRGFQQTAAQARERLPRLLELAARYGLKVQICIVNDSALVAYDVYGHADQVARIAAAAGDVVFALEGGNEVEDGEQRHDIDWRRVLEIVRAAGFRGLFTVGAARSDELIKVGEDRYDYPLGRIGDFASTHPWRGHESSWQGDGCRLKEGIDISETLGVPIAFGEPDQADRWPEGFAMLIGALGAGCNAAVVLHTTQGRDATPLTGANLGKLRAFVQGHQALEAGPWEYRNATRKGAWGNSPVARGAFEEGDPTDPAMLPGGHLVRSYSFVRDGHGFTVPTGQRPQDPGAFEIGNGWRTAGPDVAARDGVRIVEVTELAR